MKKLILILFVAVACEAIGPDRYESGQLRISFDMEAYGVTRAVPEVPDTGDFIITINDSKGAVLYSGKYSACPEVLELSAGSYVVKAVSCSFDKPAFSKPQYGDEQCVVVPAGGVAHVKLACSQQNCGVALKIDGSFLEGCPEGVLFLRCDHGKLMYSYSEKRTAYFLPGRISLVLNQGDGDEVLMTRSLNSCEMLTLGVSAAISSTTSPAASVSVRVDTSRVWMYDEFVIGGQPQQGEGQDEALTISQARNSAGAEEVWVSGYIVGGDLTSSAASFEAPFTSRTNLVLGPKSSTTDRSACMSMQLPAGDVREALNLVDNPENLGRRLYVKGDLVEAYYGIPGIKNVTEFELR